MKWPWELDAVKGYRYEEADVRFERLDGWLSGALIGLLLGAALMVIGLVPA